MADFVMSCCAYCKMVLHVLKYPHSSVFGLLIGEKKKGTNSYRLVDIVPLVHQSTSLITAVETGMCHVDDYCHSMSPSKAIVGLYHASEKLKNSSLDPFCSKVAEKIQNNFPEAVLIRIDNTLLGIDSYVPCYVAYCYSAENKSWKLKDKEKFVLDNEEQTLATVSACIQAKLYRDLVDFDNHLDNPTLDYWNDHVNAKIESVLCV